jgi:acetolactate synthase I/II/III large subunit
MRAVDATLASLKRAGVTAIFGLPGGPVIPLFDALHDDPDIRTFLVRHEQGAGHMAEGYAKVTGRAGVCTATSGPGATNLVTPIADAYMDSVPLVAITGQVGATRVGTDAFQEADIVGITLPIVKHSYLIKDADELPLAMAEALHVAQTGRPCPVLVDVCVDQWGRDVEDYTETVPPMAGYRPPEGAGHPRQIEAAARALAAAERPVVYAGGGIISGEASAELTHLSEVTGIPVNTTLMGLGGFPGTHPLFIGMPGMHGLAAATYAFQAADLILAVGVRFDERVLSTVMNEWAPNAKIIHIDVDPAEISKNRSAHIGIAGQAAPALAALAHAYTALAEPHDAAARAAWVDQIAAWKRQHPYRVDEGPEGVIQPQRVVQAIYRITRGDAIVCTDVGQHQMWAAQHYPFDRPRRWITSGGLGTMGFGLPAALGAQVAHPDELVVVISGDGSFEMTLQELSTAQMYGLPVKVVILNNGYLGMVRQWQELFWGGRYAGSSFEPFQPSFAGIAAAYGIHAATVHDPSDLDSAIAEAFAADGPALVDVHVSPLAKVFPMVPSGKGPGDIMVGPAG